MKFISWPGMGLLLEIYFLQVLFSDLICQLAIIEKLLQLGLKLTRQQQGVVLVKRFSWPLALMQEVL